jgi:hypothetical protein
LTIVKDPIENNIDNQDDNDDKPTFITLNSSKRYKRDIISNRFKYINRVNLLDLPTKSKSAALSVYSPIAGQQQKTILTKPQLLQCADAFTNSGVLRTAVNRHIDYILGDRTKFSVDLNEELTEFATDEEKDKLKSELDNPEISQLRTNIIRVNKRVELHDRMVKLLQNAFIFGRGALQIVRFPKNNKITSVVNTQTGKGEQEERPPTESESKEEGMTWTGQYGEPQALLPLNTNRIVDVKVNARTGAFEGFYYDYGIVNKNNELIKPIELIPAWIDDCNLYDNTLYSGLSPLWPILNVVQANMTIDDEDIPESTKQFWAKFGFVYTGTSKASVTARFKEQAEGGSIVFHNQKDLVAQILDIGKDLTELTEVRRKNSEYILQCLGLPVFFMFEDSPNHATAIASLQAYKVGTLRRYRTWVRNILEKYWYDPILADHLNVTVDEVISQRIKVRATFEDIVFDIFKDQVSALMSLHNAGVYDDEKVLKELGADDMWQRKREMEALMKEQEMEALKEIDEIGDDPDNMENEARKLELQRQKTELNNNNQGKPSGFNNRTTAPPSNRNRFPFRRK